MHEQGEPTRFLMSVLEAHVEPEYWSRLEASFSALVPQRSVMVESYLTQSIDEPTRWQLVTIWRSHQVFDEYRAAAPTSQVVVFQAVGAEPRLSTFEVARWLGERSIVHRDTGVAVPPMLAPIPRPPAHSPGGR